MFFFLIMFSSSNFQCETKWKYHVKRFKEYERNRQQTGARRMNFEFAEEMAEALRNRTDIFPAITVGNRVDTTSQIEGTLKRNPDSETSENPKKRQRKPRQNDEAISKCIDLLETVTRESIANDRRRLDLFERMVNTMEKKNQ